MVRIIAELSINTPTASSGDRYKYRYGCGGGGCGGGNGGSGYNEKQQIIYKRTAHALIEKEKEKEDLKKEEVQVINPILGKIIYRSRTGELFFAQHSVHLTTTFVFDKTRGESIQSQTQKVVWNDKVFETKQDWFREMARSCIDRADETMKIVSCE